MRPGLPRQQGAESLPVPVVCIQIHKYNRPRAALQTQEKNRHNYLSARTKSQLTYATQPVASGPLWGRDQYLRFDSLLLTR